MMLAQELSTTAVATNPAFRNRRAISAGKLNLMLFPWCQVNWNASNDAPLFLVSGWGKFTRILVLSVTPEAHVFAT